MFFIITLLFMCSIAFGQQHHAFLKNVNHPQTLHGAQVRYADILKSLEKDGGKQIWQCFATAQDDIINEWNLRHPIGPIMDKSNMFDILDNPKYVTLEQRRWNAGQIKIAHRKENCAIDWSTKRGHYGDGEWVVSSLTTGPFLSIHCGNLLFQDSAPQSDGNDGSTITLDKDFLTSSNGGNIILNINVEGATANATSNSGGNTTTSSTVTDGVTDKSEIFSLFDEYFAYRNPQPQQPGHVQRPVYQHQHQTVYQGQPTTCHGCVPPSDQQVVYTDNRPLTKNGKDMATRQGKVENAGLWIIGLAQLGQLGLGINNTIQGNRYARATGQWWGR